MTSAFRRVIPPRTKFTTQKWNHPREPLLGFGWIAAGQARARRRGGNRLSARHWSDFCLERSTVRFGRFSRRWSQWRHRHQRRAPHCHYQRQRLHDHSVRLGVRGSELLDDDESYLS